MDNIIKIEGIFTKAINFSMQQNSVPIIISLKIDNLSQTQMNNLSVRITTIPNFTQEKIISIDSVMAETQYNLDAINLKIDLDYLFSLMERITGEISIKLIQDENILHEICSSIELLPYDQWAGLAIMPEMVSAFITPNHPGISKILLKAGSLLEEWTKSPSFTAYQTLDPNKVRLQMAAIYGAIQSENIIYIQAPPSFEQTGQKIRLCNTIFEEKMANCLDLTLLYAACLEAVGLNPIIVFIQGHAFAGCWLENKSFPESIQDDKSILTKRVAEGIHEICVVECTAMNSGEKALSFDEAEKLVIKSLSNEPFALTIDVKRSRGGGIRPIPLRVKNEDGGFTFEKATLREEKKDYSKISPEEIRIYDKLQYVDEIALTKQQIWERKLLDLSMRNTLLNFRITSRAVQLIINDLSSLEDAISTGEEFQILHMPEDLKGSLRDSKIFRLEQGEDIIDILLENEFKNKRLRTFLNETEIAVAITSLYRQAKTGFEENGANTLFLALGFLKWYETDLSEKVRYAPLALIPVDVVRKSALKGYVIRVRDEDPQMNITLLEMLRQDFGITLNGLDPLPLDEKGVDLNRIFNIIRQAVMSKSRWDVERLAFLGIFSFGQFIMWNDIRNRSEELAKNKIVRSLMTGKTQWEVTNPFHEPKDLDMLYKPSDLAIPTSVDSSQLTAICAASSGNTFVLHGPPGTGKSQTITNIISNMLFQGKTVLFIAEKMAALSVVEKRLENIGIGHFSLEIHSNKARKRDILSQLEETLNLGKIKHPSSYNETASRLHSLREKLGETMATIHKERSCGISFYQAISAYENAIDSEGEINIPLSAIENMTRESYSHWKDLVGKVAVAWAESDNAYDDFFRINNKNYSAQMKESLEENAVKIKKSAAELVQKAGELNSIFGVKLPDTYSSCEVLNSLCGFFIESKTVSEKIFDSKELKDIEGILGEVFPVGRICSEIKTKLTRDFTESILVIDDESIRLSWQQAEAKWFLPKFFEQNKILKGFKSICKNPTIVNKNTLIGFLNDISTYKKNHKILEQYSDVLGKLYGLKWKEESSDFDELSQIYENTLLLIKTVNELFPQRENRGIFKDKLKDIYFENADEFCNVNRNLFTKYMAKWKELQFALADIAEKLHMDFSFITTLGDLQNIISNLHKNSQKLRDWCVYLTVRESIAKSGMECVTQALENKTVTSHNLLGAFDKNIHKQLAENMASNDALLKSFSGTLLDDDIKLYSEINAQFEALTRNELVARLSARVPDVTANTVDSSEIGILKRAIRSGARGMSIRQLFDKIPNLLNRLAPCMLMSPISVAQYIAPSYPEFDLVIFDEASQMPTCEAVGAIARGKNLVVVGDPKQLPPTSFFMSTKTDDENFETEDLESILDDCLALNIPQTYLLWHYRSKHESLIAFSNMNYYGNELLTFPSKNDLISNVTFVPVDGVYDRSQTRQNHAEATAVVDEIIKRLSDENLRKLSIGVVTFSAAQQSLIEDKLQEAFTKYLELDVLNAESGEPIFVKNLENVQGDERDVILFSIGYGKDKDGKLNLNFGPLNRAGGWRRLNVAVSRARHEMKVFSTLQPEHIDMSRTRSEGVAGLKAFLEFAKNGKLPVMLTEKAENNSDSFEESVAHALRQRGYQTKLHVGRSRYHIGIGIINPNNLGEYVLGIICDAQRNADNATVRDISILQDSVLEGLGWHIHHLWSLDWFYNKEKELDKIEQAIRKGLEEKSVKAKVDKTANVESYEKIIEPEVSNQLTIYKECILSPSVRPSEDFYIYETRRYVEEQIRQVLQIEAPICKALLTKRVINAWGMTRSGNRINSHIDSLIKSMGIEITESLNMKFCWDKNQNPDDYMDFRIPQSDSERRSIDNISKEEIACGIKYILTAQISMEKDDLKREIQKLFGYSRVNSNLERYLDIAIEYTSQKNWVLSDGTKVALV